MSNALPDTQPDLFDGTPFSGAWERLRHEILTQPEWASYRAHYGIRALEVLDEVVPSSEQPTAAMRAAVEEACEAAGLYA